VALTEKLDDATGKVRVDPGHIEQIVMNLVVNARDAMPGGGVLTVSMENAVLDETYAAMNPGSKPGSYVLVAVGDTGTGIAPEHQQRIFEPFFTTKEVGKGTGLGLSTTLSIVKSHNGFISLYSEMGKGTKFKVYLPANTVQAEEVVAAGPARMPHGQGEVVLVVDDEEAIRTIARRTLERFGYRVLLVAHGAEALAVYVQHREAIAVVLTDMAMPIMDGPSMIVALKSINPGVRIIGSSGLMDNAGIAKAVGAGVEDFVPKPYSAETMLKILRKVLERPADDQPARDFPPA
jgi:CheY-like chemotaxis protein